MSHTKEPWDEETHARHSVAKLYRLIGPCDYGRIVACVNACAGISTHSFERVKNNVTPIFELLLQTTQQRDELLAAAKEIMDTEMAEMACIGSHAPAEHALGLLEAAVARVEAKP